MPAFCLPPLPGCSFPVLADTNTRRPPTRPPVSSFFRRCDTSCLFVTLTSDDMHMFCEHPQTKATKGNHLVETTAGRVLTNYALPLHQNEERKKCEREKKNRPNHGALRCGPGTMRRAQNEEQEEHGKKSKLAKKKKVTPPGRPPCYMDFFFFFPCGVVMNLGHCQELCTASCIFFPPSTVLFVQCVGRETIEFD